MDGSYYFQHDLSPNCKLVISEITHKEAGEIDAEFVDGWGYYLMCYERANDQSAWAKTFLAKMVDEAAACDFWTLLKTRLGKDTP